MKRRRLLVGLAALAATAARAGAQALPTVRITCLPSDSYGEAYYAQDLGTFAKHGLSIDIVASVAGAIGINALAGGSADVSVANPLSVAQAVAKGIPITIIAGGGLYTTASPATLLLVPQRSTAHTAKDLEGEVVGLPGLGDQIQAAMTLWLQRNGADPAKVKFIEVNPARLIYQALANGRIDAGTPPEPQLTQSLQAGARILGDPFSAVAPRFYIGLWIARTDWVKANLELAHRFASAIYESGRWANAHPNESAAILAKYAQGDALEFRRMRRATYADALDPRLVQPPIDAGVKTGLLSAPLSATDLVAKGF